jgi:hypothetical protein
MLDFLVEKQSLGRYIAIFNYLKRNFGYNVMNFTLHNSARRLREINKNIKITSNNEHPLSLESLVQWFVKNKLDPDVCISNPEKVFVSLYLSVENEEDLNQRVQIIFDNRGKNHLRFSQGPLSDKAFSIISSYIKSKLGEDFLSEPSDYILSANKIEGNIDQLIKNFQDVTLKGQDLLEKRRERLDKDMEERESDLKKEKALNEQRLIDRAEKAEAELARKDAEFNKRIKEKEKEIADKDNRSLLRIETKENVLNKKEDELKDREIKAKAKETRAERRDKQNKINDFLEDRHKNFGVSKRTESINRIFRGVILFAVVVLSYYTYLLFRNYTVPDSQYSPWVGTRLVYTFKLIGVPFALVSFFVYWLKYEVGNYRQRVAEEFAFHKDQIDIMRGIWINETVMEYVELMIDNGVKPTQELLDCLTATLGKGLFDRDGQSKNTRSLTPTEEMILDTVGASRSLRLKHGNTEFELNGKQNKKDAAKLEAEANK